MSKPVICSLLWNEFFFSYKHYSNVKKGSYKFALFEYSCLFKIHLTWVLQLPTRLQCNIYYKKTLRHNFEDHSDKEILSWWHKLPMQLLCYVMLCILYLKPTHENSLLKISKYRLIDATLTLGDQIWSLAAAATTYSDEV